MVGSHPHDGARGFRGACQTDGELRLPFHVGEYRSEARQEFPVDSYSIEVFRRQGLEASVTNTWAMEIEPGKRFLYELSRPGSRLFQVEFDLATPVELPPAASGD